MVPQRGEGEGEAHLDRRPGYLQPVLLGWRERSCQNLLLPTGTLSLPPTPGSLSARCTPPPSGSEPSSPIPAAQMTGHSPQEVRFPGS